ncbi:MAG: HEPN domain-containing protein [Bacteroidetes bacterium]|nr:HEPN domain-containing protein [Bacteroidota bacterium]
MKPHEEWLFKAAQDIESSIVLLDSMNSLFDIAIYHTQQCAEKSLKAFLSFCSRDIGRTHNLLFLLETCILIDETFDNIYEDCIYLNPFATLYRYPEGDLMPKKAEVETAIEKASRILNFVKVNITDRG